MPQLQQAVASDAVSSFQAGERNVALGPDDNPSQVQDGFLGMM